MDPNHWSNYNQYSRLPGSLPTPHSAFPLLDQAGLSSGLSLTHSLQPHAPLPQRALGTLPAVNYAAAHHSALHSSTMSQIIESMSPLAGSFNPQSLHKGMGLGQNPLVFDSVRGDQQIPVSSARFSSTPGFSASKSSLFAEEHAMKEPPHAYSSPSVISQSPSVESGTKGWGLSNFMPPPSSNPFGAISSMDLSSALPVSAGGHRSSQPPPAHSSASRHSAIQRNPFSPESLLEPSSRSGRSEMNTPSSPQVHSIYGMMGLARQHGHSTPVSQHQMEFHSIHPHGEIEDLSSGSQQQNQMFYAMSSSYSSSTPTNTTSYAGSQLSAADINYDPVSPATPLSENQPGETAFPTTVSFADLNAIGAGQQGASKSRSGHSGPPGLSLPEPKEVPQHLHSLMMPQPPSRGRGSKSQVQQISASVNSPHQHSPISVGSPQAPMSSIGSPQNVMPSSTVKPAAPPVQAMADSSTTPAKPKKPRSRKKPKTEILKNTPTSRPVPQFQPPDNQTLMQTQFGNSTSSPSPQAAMRMRGAGSMGENMGGDGGGYQVMSSVGNQQVSPISDQSPRSQQQNVDAPSLITLSNSNMSGGRSSVDAGMKNASAAEPMMSGAYQDEPELMPQQAAQFDLQAFSSQPYMEQLVSAQPSHVRLIPGNVYSDAMHVAAGLPVFPTYGYQTVPEGSTIDEAAFSSLFDTSSGSKPEQTGAVLENSLVELESHQPVQVSKPSATFTAPVEEDDELCNFAQPPPELVDKDKPVFKPNPLNNTNSANPAEPQQTPEVKVQPPVKQPAGFQDSFLSFLMGKKQETLSSVTSATIGEKPQLPKYIPEPRRPAPPRHTSQDSAAHSSTPLSFSDDEENSSNVGMAVKNAISSLGRDSDSDDSDVVETGYSVQRTKDLTVKITLQNTLKRQNKRGRPRGGGVGRGRGRGEILPKAKSGPREPTPPPPRESIGRRAKDLAKVKASRKKKKHQDSGSSSSNDEDSEEAEVKPKGPGRVRRESGSESAYDSDKDPVWTPFAEESPRRPPAFGFDPLPTLEPRPKKGKSKAKRGTSRAIKEGGHQHEVEHHDVGDISGSPAKVARVSDSGDNAAKNAANGASKRVSTSTKQDEPPEASDPNFQVGRFLLEKKDLHNYESYPVWRLEQGRMLRKFEMFIDNGRVLHKAVSTYSSWVPTMGTQFVPIRVLVITNKPHGEIVEVLEEYRPKPPSDGSLEVQYEDDPLVDHFNVYLQIFLSQSLEPSFLAAIRKSKEYFYLVPLEKIDKMIEAKLEQIDHAVQWKPRFRECMRMKPQMREINRPNLKQSCQACENSSPPTIKSVLFHGAPYDRFLLTDLPDSDNSSTEFLVGKTAAPYVTQYHSLHHFKYRLYQRCRAKVHMVRESNKSQNIKDESILDQCLQNRAWVLKLPLTFDGGIGDEFGFLQAGRSVVGVELSGKDEPLVPGSCYWDAGFSTERGPNIFDANFITAGLTAVIISRRRL
ncbi:hypothetical protein BaRGS_00019937, partial [Batillaria attramentaria]